MDGGPIVFYDGECGLCDRTVQRLIRLDHRRVLRFATLQGETARRLIGVSAAPSETWSMKFLDDQGVHERSDAILRAIATTGGLARAAGLLRLVPRSIRDAAYRWVARNRYRWFGRTQTCTLPTPALRERFLP